MPVGIIYVGRPKNEAPDKSEKEDVPREAPEAVQTPSIPETEDVEEEGGIPEVEEAYEDKSLRELKGICEERGLGERTERGNWIVRDAEGRAVTKKIDIANLLRATDES